MKLGTKKIIAQEILILASCILILLVAFACIKLWNNYQENKYEKLEINHKALSNEIKILENNFDTNYGVVNISPNKKLKELYDLVSQKYDIGSYNDYKIKMYNPEKRELLHSKIGDEYNLGTFSEFEESIGFNQIYETPNGIRIPATDLIQNYGERFDDLVQQKHLKLYQKPFIIKEIDTVLINQKTSDNKKIEILKEKNLVMNDELLVGTDKFNLELSLNKLVLVLFIILYPFRLFIIGIKWSINTIKKQQTE